MNKKPSTALFVVEVLVLALAIVLPLTVFAQSAWAGTSGISMTVNAKKADGAQLRLQANGPHCKDLTGRALVKDAEGNRIKVALIGDPASQCSNLSFIANLDGEPKGRVAVDILRSIEIPSASFDLSGLAATSFDPVSDKLQITFR